MPRLLISVRSELEARAALAGGADVLDVKEPAAGPLGMASPRTIRAVVQMVDCARLVSAALGELTEWPVGREVELAELPPLSWVKVGLSRSGDSWPAGLLRLCRARPEAGWIAVAYADWRRAAAPAPAAVVRFAIEHDWAGVLFDTWIKDGTRLTDWQDQDALAEVAAACKAAGKLLALAGSLRRSDLRGLASLDPDVFALRGAACRGGERANAIDPEAVRALAEACRSFGGNQTGQLPGSHTSQAGLRRSR